MPASKYAPWFGVVLKGARLAVKVLQLLSLEARASKLRCGGKHALISGKRISPVAGLVPRLPAGYAEQR